MLIKIFHRDRICPSDPDEPGVFEHVANFQVKDGADVLHALEAAYAASQNIMGSWSRGAFLDGPDGQLVANGDHQPNIEVLVDLPVHDGKVWGLRSSCVGDKFEAGGKVFFVASFGFEEEGALKAFEVFQLSEEKDVKPALIWSGEAVSRYAAKAKAREAAQVGDLAHLYAVAQ